MLELPAPFACEVAHAALVCDSVSSEWPGPCDVEAWNQMVVLSEGSSHQEGGEE